jgi:hypothetical protein
MPHSCDPLRPAAPAAAGWGKITRNRCIYIHILPSIRRGARPTGPPNTPGPPGHAAGRETTNSVPRPGSEEKLTEPPR